MKYLFALLATSTLIAADCPRMAFTKDQAREFTLNWFQAWVGGPAVVDRLLSFYTPDAEYVDPNVPKGIKGTEELRGFFKLMLANHPDWKFEIVELYPTEKGFILNWKADIPLKNGRLLKDFRGVDILEFRDGKISKHQDYFDLSVFRTE